MEEHGYETDSDNLKTMVLTAMKRRATTFSRVGDSSSWGLQVWPQTKPLAD